MTFASSIEIKKYLESEFKNCSDFIIREMPIYEGKTIYVASLINISSRSYIADNLLKPLTYVKNDTQLEDFFEKSLTPSSFKEMKTIEDAITQILDGSGLIFADIAQSIKVYAAPARNDNGRSPSEPHSEVAVRGPREGFIESAEINIALLRKRIKTQNFKVEKIQVGKHTNTSICVLYIKGTTDEQLVERVKKEIQKINLPGVIDSGYIEHYLQGSNYPLFSNVGNSEKPDKVAAKLLEGRVCIMCDGSPVVLSVPYLFVESVQSAEDYLKTPYYASFVRILRMAGLFLALYLPSLYVAMLEHHTSVIPPKLYLTIINARQNMPFSVFWELIIILLIFELVREVGLRIPKAIGDAVSIVGGLILGDAAIKAGIASSPVIIIASLTAICGFINPPYMNSTVIIRLINTVFARLWGLCGIAFSFIFLLIFLANKTSFGYPYFYPFAPLSLKALTDGILLNPKKSLKNSEREIYGKEDIK